MAALDVCVDNVFEWYTGESVATVTFSQKKWVNKIKKYSEEYPEVVIVAENEDGCICAHVPVSWFKFSPPKKGRIYTEEEKQIAAARLAEARRKRNGKAS